jgi:hypothetical protein
MPYTEVVNWKSKVILPKNMLSLVITVKKIILKNGVVLHDYNSSIREAQAEGWRV